MPSSSLLTVARSQVLASRSALESQLQGLDDSQAGETKSSAGDKFETSREMMQQQRDQLSAQLQVVLEQALLLEVCERKAESSVIGLGSVVTLDSGERYLIACGIGRLKTSGSKAFAISLESPIGQVLKGLTASDTASFRGKELKVTSVE